MDKIDTYCRLRTNNHGFSLIELMVVMGVLAILLTVGAPAFVNLTADNRILSEAYALRATMNNARSEALTQRSFVTVCESSDGASCADTGTDWNKGFIAFTDFDGDGVVDAGSDQIIQSKVLDQDTLTISYSNAANRVRFDSRGNALNFSGTLIMCDDRGDSSAKGIAVSNLGSVKSLVDSDNPKNGTVNLPNGGVDVSCP